METVDERTSIKAALKRREFLRYKADCTVRDVAIGEHVAELIRDYMRNRRNGSSANVAKQEP